MTTLGLTNIAQLSKCLRERSLSALTIAEKSLQLADKLSEFNAFITLTPEVATKQALQCDVQLQSDDISNKPLNGVPIAVKDNFCTEGIRTTCASKMLKNFIPTYNATVYERLKSSGTVLIGKTNLDQFAMGSGTVDSIFGPTKNVWSENLTENNFRIAGGSSGGSAVAVASGICYGAIGSDTGGSTRNPAAYCGLVGLKPSYGLLSRHGLIPLANSLDVPGILTRTIEDCVAILNATAGPDQFDSTTIKKKHVPITLPIDNALSVKNIRIGIPLEYHCEDLSQEMLEVWKRIANLLEDNGAIIKQVSLPNTASSIVVYSVLNQCEVSSNMARYDGIEYGHRSDDMSSTEKLYARTRAEGFNIVVKNRILAGNYFLLRKNYEKYYIQALKIRRLIANDFKDVFNNNIDLLLTPTTLTDAPYYKDFIKSDNRHQCAVQDYCTQPANMAGIPAVSIPVNLSSNNLPLSIQLMGPFLSEKLLLAVAKWIEREVCFSSFVKN